MITIFNRREIAVTRFLEERARICDYLQKQNIEYKTSTNSFTNPGRQHGVIGIRSDYAYEYHIYVYRKDYKNAKLVLDLK